MGGQFARFDPVVSQYNQSGELFRIEGHCQSACTLFLAIRNVCIEPGATLLFHAGHDRNKMITASSTSHMMGAYNGRLRDFLTANHWPRHDRQVRLSAMPAQIAGYRLRWR
jgi:hypothetical protein